MKILQHYISKDDLKHLPLRAFGGTIHLIDKPELVAPAVEYLKAQKILGFDTETKPNFRKGRSHQVALLQLATDEQAFLFRLNRIGLPEPVVELLESPSIVKAGVAIADDIKMLQKLRKFVPSNFEELQKSAKTLGIEDFSLRKLAGIVLNFRISKAKQLSNWEGIRLSHAQQLYAATDAWVGCEIFKALKNRKPLPESPPAQAAPGNPNAS